MSWKGTRALVTGGAGLIGSHIVDRLLDAGAEVTILDNLEKDTHPDGKPNWIPAAARFIEGDMRSQGDLEKAVEKIDVVFHQAAFGSFAPETSKYLDVNVTGTAMLYEALAKENCCHKVVVASSQAAYGEGLYRCDEHGMFHPQTYREKDDLEKGFFSVRCPRCKKAMKPMPTGEDTELFGEFPYSLSKAFEERTCLALGRKFQIPSVALRYAVTYGPRQSVYNPYTGVVSIFSTRILNNKAPVIYEDGKQTRDFIYVGDVAQANLFVAEHSEAVGCAFNVGTGKPTSVLDLVATLNELYGTDVAPMVRSFRPNDVRDLVHDTSRLSKLGFEAKTTLKEGLSKHVDWIKTLGGLREYFGQAEKRLRDSGIVSD